MDLRESIEKWEEENRTGLNEGPTGVKNLCKLARALGYRDMFQMGRFDGGSYGDLIEFLEDNPGCVEAIKEWMAEQNIKEWVEELGYTDFGVGDTVAVTPREDDTFTNEFVGQVVGFRDEYIQVADSEGGVFDVLPDQLELEDE
jgi:hypothetical protein